MVSEDYMGPYSASSVWGMQLAYGPAPHSWVSTQKTRKTCVQSQSDREPTHSTASCGAGSSPAPHARAVGRGPRGDLRPGSARGRRALSTGPVCAGRSTAGPCGLGLPRGCSRVLVTSLTAEDARAAPPPGPALRSFPDDWYWVSGLSPSSWPSLQSRQARVFWEEAQALQGSRGAHICPQEPRGTLVCPVSHPDQAETSLKPRPKPAPQGARYVGQQPGH